MAYFDPARERRLILTADLARELNLSREDYLPNALGNAAVLGLPTVVYGWLCGLRQETAPLLGKYSAWLEEAIAGNEPFGEFPAYSSAYCLAAYGLCRWLGENAGPKSIFRRALRQHENYWEALAPPGTASAEAAPRSTLEDYLNACIQAGEFAAGAAVYERLGERPVRSPGEVETAAEFGYWVCSRRLAGEWTLDGHLEAGERLLRSRLEYDWLGLGLALRAAAWLKVVYWDSAVASTPLAALLKAYDVMPHVPRPDFLPPPGHFAEI